LLKKDKSRNTTYL